MAPRKRWIIVIVGLIVFVGVFMTFFIAWANADGINPSKSAALVFRVVSFPVFAIAPQKLADTYFWQLGVLNSLILATLAALLSWMRLNQKVNTTPAPLHAKLEKHSR
jgi:hypothetical protein